VGGAVLFAGNIYESAVLLNELQGISKLPLIVSADFERGVFVPNRRHHVVSLDHGDRCNRVRGVRIPGRGDHGERSPRLGVHWIYAPVVDVNNNPDNPVINIRSFGEDPQLVARLGAAFIRGARQ